jgi:hypothetical protein
MLYKAVQFLTVNVLTQLPGGQLYRQYSNIRKIHKINNRKNDTCKTIKLSEVTIQTQENVVPLNRVIVLT